MSLRSLATSLFLTAVAALFAIVWWLGFVAALDRLAERGQSDLSLASGGLVGELRQLREVAVLTASHPGVLALTADPASDPAPVEQVLLRASDVTGALELMLVDRDGHVMASSLDASVDQPGSQPHLRRALQGAFGLSHEIDPSSGQRVFDLAAPVFRPGGPVAGAVILRVSAARIEAAWAGQPLPVFFTDAQGLVFITNRRELLFARRHPPLPGSGSEAAAYPGAVERAFANFQTWRIGGHEIWQLEAGPYLPGSALRIAQDLPVIGMQAEALVDSGPASRQALTQATVAAALCLVLGAGLLLVSERRRVLGQRLKMEADINAVLEARVTERTAELSATNDRLRRAQAELVLASRMSALGQMSAGISHELNQPLMAIRSYAENAATYLGLGRVAEASGNLDRISDLARRMGRIIRNLRAFARQETEPSGPVDLVAVVAAALDLTAPRLAEAGVTVAWQPPGQPVMVRGGEVRLQQVVVNLLSNAADAMQGQPRRQVAIDLSRAAGKVRLAVTDTGPGIAEPDRIFDPFYTTKEVGSGEGLGLGLAISYGLVQGFGGALAGSNLPQGGAVFTLDLLPADAEREGGA
jgi:two-component system C4-dicarboxylate transport sensor histidine kinase DctB